MKNYIEIYILYFSKDIVLIFLHSIFLMISGYSVKTFYAEMC